MIVTIKHSHDFDIADVLSRSPDANIPDVERVTNECLSRSIKICYGAVNNKVACVWGIIQPTLLSEAVYLWLITTDIIAEHKFLFIRHSQLYVEELLKEYNVIIGDAMTNNEPAKRWLRWLGAEFSTPVGGRMPFTIRKKLNV